MTKRPASPTDEDAVDSKKIKSDLDHPNTLEDEPCDDERNSSANIDQNQSSHDDTQAMEQDPVDVDNIATVPGGDDDSILEEATHEAHRGDKSQKDNKSTEQKSEEEAPAESKDTLMTPTNRKRRKLPLKTKKDVSEQIDEEQSKAVASKTPTTSTAKVKKAAKQTPWVRKPKAAPKSGKIGIADRFYPWDSEDGVPKPEVEIPVDTSLMGCKPVFGDDGPRPTKLQPSAKTSNAGMIPEMWEDRGHHFKVGDDQTDNLFFKLVSLQPGEDPQPVVYYTPNGVPKDWASKDAIKQLNDRRREAIMRYCNDAPWTIYERERLRDIIAEMPNGSIWDWTELHNEIFVGNSRYTSAFRVYDISDGRTVESVAYEYRTFKTEYDAGDLPPETTQARTVHKNSKGQDTRLIIDLIFIGDDADGVDRLSGKLAAALKSETFKRKRNGTNSADEKVEEVPQKKPRLSANEESEPFADQVDLSQISEELLDLATRAGESRRNSISSMSSLSTLSTLSSMFSLSTLSEAAMLDLQQYALEPTPAPEFLKITAVRVPEFVEGTDLLDPVTSVAVVDTRINTAISVQDDAIAFSTTSQETAVIDHMTKEETIEEETLEEDIIQGETFEGEVFGEETTEDAPQAQMGSPYPAARTIHLDEDYDDE